MLRRTTLAPRVGWASVHAVAAPTLLADDREQNCTPSASTSRCPEARRTTRGSIAARRAPLSANCRHSLEPALPRLTNCRRGCRYGCCEVTDIALPELMNCNNAKATANRESHALQLQRHAASGDLYRVHRALKTQQISARCAPETTRAVALLIVHPEGSGHGIRGSCAPPRVPGGHIKRCFGAALCSMRHKIPGPVLRRRLSSPLAAHLT